MGSEKIHRRKVIHRDGPSNLKKLRAFCKDVVGYPLSKCIISTIIFLINVIISIIYPEWMLLHLSAIIFTIVMCIVADIDEPSSKVLSKIFYFVTFNMIVYMLYVLIGLFFYLKPYFKKKETTKKEGPFKRLKKAIDGE